MKFMKAFCAALLCMFMGITPVQAETTVNEPLVLNVTQEGEETEALTQQFSQ